MSTRLTAYPTLYKTPDDVLPIVASFAKDLARGDLLTGTPTVAVSPSGPVVSAAQLNTEAIAIEIDGKVDHHAKARQAVQFTMSGGTAGQTYTVTVTASTVAGRTFGDRPIQVVVSND